MNALMNVAGIDVGGIKKGFNLVILQGAQIVDVLSSTEPMHLHERCLQYDVQAVGIDAPSQWRAGANGRAAERAMARERISCFSTPDEVRARANTSGFYDWMFNGVRIYEAFSVTHPVLDSEKFEGKHVCFETFPHAITCAFLGRDVAKAKLKLRQRRGLVDALALNTHALKTIDDIDAALCAITAQRLIEGKTRAYGDAASGFIFVPDERKGP